MPTDDTDKGTREAERRDADLIAQTFMARYPGCFDLLGPDVVIVMVEGFILRRVLDALSSGRTHGKEDVRTIRRLSADVFNAANHLSAKAGPTIEF